MFLLATSIDFVESVFRSGVSICRFRVFGYTVPIQTLVEIAPDTQRKANKHIQKAYKQRYSSHSPGGCARTVQSVMWKEDANGSCIELLQ